jgi:hypothetical protein
MTRKPNSDIDILLGDTVDPDRRARLVAGLAAALNKADKPAAIDESSLAAYLDGGLSEAEKQALHAELSASGETLADLQDAIELLEAVQNSTAVPSPALLAQAAAILQPEEKPPAERAPRRWLLRPRVQLGFGLALASIVALIVVTPMIRSTAPGPSAPSASVGQGSEAVIGGDAPAQSWGAIAISAPDKVYGVAQGSLTQSDAVRAAVLDCRSRGGGDCKVAVSAEKECFAVAGQKSGAPVAAAARNISDAGNRALAMCGDGQANIGCSVLATFCSGQ